MSDATDWKQKFFEADNDVHELAGTVSEVCDKIEGTPEGELDANELDGILSEILNTLRDAIA